jgi:hypothetical protein
MIFKAFLIDIKQKKVVEKLESQKDPALYASIRNSFKEYAKSLTYSILD